MGDQRIEGNIVDVSGKMTVRDLRLSRTELFSFLLQRTECSLRIPPFLIVNVSNYTSFNTKFR